MKSIYNKLCNSKVLTIVLTISLCFLFQLSFQLKSEEQILDSQTLLLLETAKDVDTVYSLEELSTIINEIDSKIYPVGSIYMTTDSTNPKEIYGGTWERFGEGKTLVGVDKNDSAFNKAELTGGVKTTSVTLSLDNLPSHTHAISSLSGTTSTSGTHTHTFSGTTALNSATQNHKIYTAAGSTQAYWFRPAGGSANQNSYSWSGLASDHNHTHTFSGTTNSGGAHTHSITVNAGKTGAVGNSTPVKVSTLQPYTTIYMWKRVA